MSKNDTGELLSSVVPLLEFFSEDNKGIELRTACGKCINTSCLLACDRTSEATDSTHWLLICRLWLVMLHLLQVRVVLRCSSFVVHCEITGHKRIHDRCCAVFICDQLSSPLLTCVFDP